MLSIYRCKCGNWKSPTDEMCFPCEANKVGWEVANKQRKDRWLIANNASSSDVDVDFVSTSSIASSDGGLVLIKGGKEIVKKKSNKPPVEFVKEM